MSEHNLVFVDCEAYGGAPSVGALTEFGAVMFTRATFHGILIDSIPNPENPAIPIPSNSGKTYDAKKVFTDFDAWLTTHSRGRPIFVSDNPAYDFMWIADGFHKHLGYNPFGHSGRRISDFYAGLTHNWTNTQKWKRLRITPHTHNPVMDAMGNMEAFERLMKGER